MNPAHINCLLDVATAGGNTLTLESLRSEMEAHFTDITDRLANVESLLRALYVSSGGQPSTLGLRRPPVPPFHSVSSNAPITSSAIGSASTASAVNVSGLSLDGSSAFETSGTGTSKGKGKDKGELIVILYMSLTISQHLQQLWHPLQSTMTIHTHSGINDHRIQVPQALRIQVPQALRTR